jgi:hypothetical protein
MKGFDVGYSLVGYHKAQGNAHIHKTKPIHCMVASVRDQPDFMCICT